jgi:hypothetical protein
MRHRRPLARPRGEANAHKASTPQAANDTHATCKAGWPDGDFPLRPASLASPLHVMPALRKLSRRTFR